MMAPSSVLWHPLEYLIRVHSKPSPCDRCDVVVVSDYDEMSNGMENAKEIDKFARGE